MAFAPSAFGDSAIEQDREQYRVIAAELWCNLSKNPTACYNPDADPKKPAPKIIEANTTRLRNLITEAIATALRSPEASERKIAATIESIQSADPETGGWLRDWPIYAKFEHAGNTRVLVVGFSIFRCGSAIPDARPYVQFYSYESGNWILKGEVGLALRGCTLSLIRGGDRVNSRLLYWLYGTRFGDTGSRLRVEVVKFDGSEVTDLWHRDDFVRGKLSVTDDRFSIEYDRCPHGQNWGCARTSATWSVGQGGKVLALPSADYRKSAIPLRTHSVD